MTYREMCDALRRAGVDTPEWDAACLLKHFCRVDALALRQDPERDHTSPALSDALARRCAREPLQYLIGEWDFYRQTYTVSPDCLIPRSDTEILVECAIKLLPCGARFADLCTGSGCIAVSTLAERPDTRAVALDKFPATLTLAAQNAKRNGVAERLELLCADVLSPTPAIAPFAPFDAILSNPPYIETGVLDSLSPEVHAEPQAALDGGEDGLMFYRSILQSHTNLLKKDGFFLFEIGYDQAASLLSLAKQYGFAHTRVLRDLGGCDRVVYLSQNTPYERTGSI